EENTIWRFVMLGFFILLFVITVCLVLAAKFSQNSSGLFFIGLFIPVLILLFLFVLNNASMHGS
ncbi:MAG: hypothetical protein AAF518_21765, partial [Spirochaetota bacterium]